MATEPSGVPTPLRGAYGLLEPDTGALIAGVLGRRDPELGVRLAENPDVTEHDADEVPRALYSEFAEQLDPDTWEPTEYGKRVDDAIGAFVTRFVIERDPER